MHSYLERTSGNVELMPLDEKQCGPGLVVDGAEINLIRAVSDVPGSRNNLRRFGSRRPGLEGIVPVPDGNVVAVEVSGREGDDRRRICCHRGWGLRRNCRVHREGQEREDVRRAGDLLGEAEAFLLVIALTPGYGRR